MNKKHLVLLLPLICLAFIPSITQAATITACTFNKTAYNPGDSGYVSVTIFNDKENIIRVTELTANFDYYYSDGNTYIQTFFFPSADLPIEIALGQSETIDLPFTLPNNIAPGYVTLFVRAKTQIWHNNSETWYTSDYPTYQPTIYIESSYKQYYEAQQALNDELETENNQLQKTLTELQAINTNTTNIMYLLLFTTLTFVAITIFLGVLRKPRSVPNTPS